MACYKRKMDGITMEKKSVHFLTGMDDSRANYFCTTETEIKYLEENYLHGTMQGRQFRYNCDGSLQCAWDCAGGMTLLKLDYEMKECAANCKFDRCLAHLQ